MKKLGIDDATERLIDDVGRLDHRELASLDSDGWRLVEVTEQVSRAGNPFHRHRFRHKSVPPPGAI